MLPISSEIGFHNYNVCWHDRTIQTNALSKDGGILITISKNFHSKLILIENSNLELLFVLLNISYLTIIIGSVYIPLFQINLMKTYIIYILIMWNPVCTKNTLKQLFYYLVILIYHHQPFQMFILILMIN